MTERAGAVRLFCLPYAGGGAAPYHRWRPGLPDWLDLLPLNLPGRESRAAHPPYTELEQLASNAAAVIATCANHPYALLGHSLGAVAALEITRKLRQSGHPLPRLLIVTGCRAPQVMARRSPIHQLPETEFLGELASRYNGIPAVVLENRELLDLLLPVLRADVGMLETHTYVDEPPLDVEILALGGTADAAVTAADLNAWRIHTSQRFSARLLPGGHFFLFDDEQGAARMAWDTIVNRLAEFASG
jgi:surfactin synthase thioesterase subunit